MSRRRPVVTDRRTALWGGLGLLAAGSWLIYQAYEGRGQTRPFLVRLATVA